MEGKYVKKKKMIKKLFSLCLEISKGKPTVFFSYSAHVNMISIESYENGWKSDVTNKEDKKFQLYTDDDFDYDDYIEAIAYLEALKNETEL